MTEAHALAVTIDLDAARDPVAGVLHGPDGLDRPFVGWLALLSLVGDLQDRALEREQQ